MSLEADFIVIGAGPAGIMAAITAARQGVRVILIEKNKSIGRKLAITGAGRCNVTNMADVNELVANIPGNGRFLFSAFQRFGPERLINFFQVELGVPLKVERGNRVFPESDKAQDVVGALYRSLKDSGVELITETKVTGLSIELENRVTGVIINDGQEIKGKSVLIATGGLSYPGTGSTGDGFDFAEIVGHSITELTPSLVPLETREEWVKKLEGLSLTNVRVTSYYLGKKLQSEFGEMLFTDFGLSGPVILSLSREIASLILKRPNSVVIVIDLKPALSETELDQRVQRDLAKSVRKIYKNALDDLLPQKLIPVIIQLSQIDPLKPVHQITKEERFQLVYLLKNLQFTINKPRSMAEAIITAGGINTKEINPKTMESKIISGLYFAGEVVDVDGYTGGFNLQIAFSMGYVAGMEVAHKLAKV